MVRWRRPCASLVAARDEGELVDILAQVEDSEGATWSVYSGPLHVNFQLPVDYHIHETGPDGPPGPGEIVIDDVGKVEDGLELEPLRGETYSAMTEAVARQAFPHVHAALWSEKEDLTEDRLRAAVSQELQLLVKAEWSKATRGQRTDSARAIAHATGLPARKLENVSRATGQLPPPKPKAPVKVKAIKKPKDPKKPTAKRKRG